MVHFIKSKGQYLKGEHFKRLFFSIRLIVKFYKAQQVKTHLLTCFFFSIILRGKCNKLWETCQQNFFFSKLPKYMYTKENKLHQSSQLSYIQLSSLFACRNQALLLSYAVMPKLISMIWKNKMLRKCTMNKHYKQKLDFFFWKKLHWNIKLKCILMNL